jgi:ABC-type lipoprotein export system ATPase subunit
MPLRHTYTCRTTLFEHERGRYICPLRFPEVTTVFTLAFRFLCPVFRSGSVYPATFGTRVPILRNLIGTSSEHCSPCPTLPLNRGFHHDGGRSLAEMSPEEKIELVRKQIGFVFQTFGLLPFLSVEENVQVPLRLLRTPRQERTALVHEMLERVGLADRADHRTHELSGGEQQRVAIARALVKRPTLILADEPTGQLDSLTGASIIALLKEITAQTGVTVVVASHDPNVHEAAGRVFELKDGRLVGTVEQDSQ